MGGKIPRRPLKFEGASIDPVAGLACACSVVVRADFLSRSRARSNDEYLYPRGDDGDLPLRGVPHQRRLTASGEAVTKPLQRGCVFLKAGHRSEHPVTRSTMWTAHSVREWRRARWKKQGVAPPSRHVVDHCTTALHDVPSIEVSHFHVW